MTQQIFTLVKNGNAFYSQSTFGFPSAFYESVPVQYSFELGQEFLIFHGQGEASPKFGFSIEITTARVEDRQLIFPYLVKLLNPAGKLVKFWNASSTNGTQSIFNFPSVPADAVEMTNYGWWKCQVFFSTPNLPGYIYFNSLSFVKNIEYLQTALTYRWLGHSFWNVLNVLTPQVGINGGQVYVTALQEMHNSVSSIPAVNITKSYDDLTGDFEMTSLSIDACSGQDILTYIKAGQDAALIAYQQAAANYQKSLSAVDESASSFALAKYQAWVKKYQTAVNEVKANDLALRILPVFSDPTISFSEYEIGGYIQFANAPTLFIKLGQGPVDTVYGFSEIDYQIEDVNVVEEALIYVFAHDKYDTIHDINGQIESAIFQNGSLILNYLYLALNKAAGQTAMVTAATAVNSEWVLTYYNQTPHPDPATAYIPHIPGPIKPPIGTGSLTAAPVGNAHPAAPVSPKAAGGVPQSPLPFKFPAGFNVVGGTAIDRLDKIQTLVVVMMENRSFDHIFGDLARTFPTVPYTCFPVGFTNNKAGNFTGPVPVCPAASLFFPDVNITPVSPEHGFKHVMNQISDGNFDTTKMDPNIAANSANLQKLGLMQGFTSDIETRFSVKGANPQYPDRTPCFDSPQMVMTYYQQNQLPTYYAIAENFKILDHWFAALPGETWPNRIATHTGKVIQLDNFSLKDPRLGYFTEQTIFDVLTEYGVDWVFMESNASILRIFNRYRIDDKNVIPLHRGIYNSSTAFDGINSDDLAGLDEVLSRPTLPRVIFIEPRFSDEPPLRKAYDDLAPTDISHGQEFIAKVYQKLAASSRWPQMSLLITYDEHGGFFDHVPPPGTAKSTLNIKVPPIYTNPDDPTDIGPSCTGVRVPAMLVSPYVSAGKVSPIVFDHTSIIKTILVSNRDKFPAGVFTSFSDRVNQAHHLGEALDLDTPRTAPPINIPTGTPSIVPSGLTSYFGVKNVSDTDYHECLRTLFMP